MDSSKKREISASILIVIAGCCWGIIALFSRELSNVHINSIQISMLRSLVSFVSLLCMTLLTNRNRLRIYLKDIWMFIGSGVLSLAFFNICYFISIEENTLSLAAILLYTAPSFVVLISRIVFKEKITKRKLLALIISFTGLLFAIGILGEKIQTTTFGLTVGLCSGIGFALYSIFSRIALKKIYMDYSYYVYFYVCDNSTITV